MVSLKDYLCGNVSFIDFVRVCLEINPAFTNEEIKGLFAGKTFWFFGMDMLFDRSKIITDFEIEHAKSRIAIHSEGMLIPLLETQPNPISELGPLQLKRALERIALVIESMTGAKIKWELPEHETPALWM